MTVIHSYVTIGGSGTRLKQISPLDKHLLYFRDKQIIQWILDIIPNAKTIGERKTNSRKETLEQISERYNILIIDCDIIPFGFDINKIDTDTDCVFVFESPKKKWGSVLLDHNNRIVSSSENNNISHTKSSGIYFIKDLKHTLANMTDNNSILSGMIGAKTIYENTFVRLGDVADYVTAINIC
jgi:hypothetical protein